MTPNGVAAGSGVSKPESLLSPLRSLTLVPSVDKLDAGLRSLDHCEQIV